MSHVPKQNTGLQVIPPSSPPTKRLSSPAPNQLHLPADGTELFLVTPDRNRAYELTFAGYFQCFRIIEGLFRNRVAPDGHADALHVTDSYGAFTQEHQNLHVDGTPLQAMYRKGDVHNLGQDREKHIYRFLVGSNGPKLPLRFFPINGVSTPESRVTVALNMLPQDTFPPYTFRYRLREEFDQRARNARLLEQLQTLQCRVQRESNYLDADFQKDFARHHREAILGSWKDQWSSEYDEFVLNTPLRKLAYKQAPEVIYWHEARMEIVRLAERFTVALSAPKVITVEPPPARKRLTAEGVRARKVRRVEVTAQDKIELATTKLAKIAEGERKIDAQEDVDPEIRERAKTELRESILEGDNDDHSQEIV